MTICGIYKITNKINLACYVGQSVDIKIRWKNERAAAFNKEDKSYNLPLYRAFRKYGIENFSFEVVEECPRSELNSKEIYYANFYKSYVWQGGYNVAFCGNQNPYWGNEKQYARFQKTVDLLLHSDLTEGEIAKEIGCCINTVCSINNGTTWRTDELSYPLRKTWVIHKHQKVAIVKKEENTKKKEKRMGIDRRLSEPPVTKEQLVTDCFISYSYAARKYGCSMKSVRRYLEYYNIPYKSQDFRNWYKETYNIPQKIVKKKFNYKVYQYDENKNLVAIYSTFAEAARAIQKDEASHGCHLAKKAKEHFGSYGGYLWDTDYEEIKTKLGY